MCASWPYLSLPLGKRECRHDLNTGARVPECDGLFVWQSDLLPDGRGTVRLTSRWDLGDEGERLGGRVCAPVAWKVVGQAGRWINLKNAVADKQRPTGRRLTVSRRPQFMLSGATVRMSFGHEVLE
jgi:hypothetical protein